MNPSSPTNQELRFTFLEKMGTGWTIRLGIYSA